MRFWAFSYSIGEPCGRSVQVSMYFMGVLVGLIGVVEIGYEWHCDRAQAPRPRVFDLEPQRNLALACLDAILIRTPNFLQGNVCSLPFFIPHRGNPGLHSMQLNEPKPSTL